MKTIIFAPETLNLSETSRMVEIAKACENFFKILFISYGGRFDYLIKEASFPIRELKPRLTDEKAKHILKIDQMEIQGDFFSEKELMERVQNEINVFEEIDPVAIVTGFCLSVTLSSRATKIPLVWILAIAGTRPYYEERLGTWPDAMDYLVIRWIPERILNWTMNSLMIKSKIFTRPFNKVAKTLNIKPFDSFLDLIEGDYVLLSDVPEFANLTKLPSNYKYIGPILPHLNLEIPEEIINLPKDKPIIYFAMGSSGNPIIIKEIIEGFINKNYRVIAPIKNLMSELKVSVPKNVIVTGWIPAEKVNPMANISVIHGGQGTVYTACLSGTPVVGIGMQSEQEGNIECLVRKGFAIRIKKKRVTANAVLKAIDKLLLDKEAGKKAKEFQKIVKNWNGSLNAANFLRDTFG